MAINFHTPDPRMVALDDSIKNGTIADASDEELQEWLHALCVQPFVSQGATSAEVNKGITVNQIQMARRLQKFQDDNDRTQRLVIILAVVAIVIGGLQFLVALVEICCNFSS